MLRLFRSRPGLLRFGAFSRAEAQTEPQTIRFQRVKIRRRLFKPMALATAAITYATAYYVYSTVTGSVIDRFLANEVADMSLEERKRLKKKIDQVEPFYVPLPGTYRMVDSKPYKGTDPEWQNFIRLSKDPKLIRSVKTELAELALAAVKKDPVLGRRYGKDLRVQGYYLDVHYPYKPAPTYEQQVLSWEPEGLAITTKPISSLAARRLTHILWPSAAGLSTWTFATELFKQNLHSTAKYLGFDTKAGDAADASTLKRTGWGPPSVGSEAASGKAQPLVKSQPDARGAKDQDALARPGSESESTSSASPTMSSRSTPSSSSTTTPDASGPDAKAARSPNAKDIYGVRQMSEHTSGPVAAMTKTFFKNFRPAHSVPPRGVVLVEGTVQLHCDECTMKVEVYAFWDPAEKKYWPYMSMKLKPLRPRHQHPVR